LQNIVYAFLRDRQHIVDQMLKKMCHIRDLIAELPVEIQEHKVSLPYAHAMPKAASHITLLQTVRS